MDGSELKAVIREGLDVSGVTERRAAEKMGMTPPEMSRFLNQPMKGIRFSRFLMLLDMAGLKVVKKS